VTEWWQEMFQAEAWQETQLAWDELEDADEQVDRVIRALRLEPGMRILDAPCGTGRIAARLAARDYEVVGVDITERFLEVGRERADGVRYERADVRELEFRDEFDAVFCLWGSFGYFDDDGNLAQARAAADALRPGGRYLIDTVVADGVLAQFKERDWFERSGGYVLTENTWAPGSGRVEADWTFLHDGRVDVRHSSVRVYTVHELSELLLSAGFASFEARDDELEPYRLGSGRVWMVATKER
jgi:SAM-dependent methyltransferase